MVPRKRPKGGQTGDCHLWLPAGYWLLSFNNRSRMISTMPSLCLRICHTIFLVCFKPYIILSRPQMPVDRLHNLYISWSKYIAWYPEGRITWPRVWKLHLICFLSIWFSVPHSLVHRQTHRNKVTNVNRSSTNAPTCTYTCARAHAHMHAHTISRNKMRAGSKRK